MTVTRRSATTWLVDSESQPGTQHIVHMHDGNLTCSCDGSYYRGHCAHGRAVENYLLSERAVERAAQYNTRTVALEAARQIVRAAS